MNWNSMIRGRKLGVSLMAAALTLCAAHSFAGSAKADETLKSWLGREYTIDTSTINDQIPVGGKMTFVFDSDDNVVRVCTRTGNNQRGAWRMDFAIPCNVTLTYTRGTRFCTADDVKAGNAEVLSACHRLRSRDIAMRPAKVNGAVELNDMIVFFVPSADGEYNISILVDSPSRVTGSGVVTGKGGG